MSATSAPPIFVSHDGLDVIAGQRPGEFLFMPRVQAEVTHAGAPTLMLITNEHGGLFQAGAVFDADDGTLRETRAAVQARVGQGTVITLARAPLTVRHATLVATSAIGDEVLGDVQTASIPPYTALFRVMLTPQQTATVLAALGGEAGRLRIVYTFELQTTAGALVRIDGDVSSAASAMGTPPSARAAITWIERALVDRVLTVTESHWGPDAEPVLAATRADCKAKVVAMLLERAIDRAVAADRHLSFESRIEKPRAIRDTRAGDVAKWFSGGRKPLVIAQPAATHAP